jgi:3-deoxy-manno-octulosonate cytidylyltransferase (CMP-KDO synthetase)
MINGKSVLVVIPARMGGYRFPDKPLRILHGKEMLRWVWEHVSASKYADEILIATPNQSILTACERFGAKVVMTSDTHRRGSERVYEACKSTNRSWDIVVNFQGDEPLVSGIWLDRAIEELERNPQVSCVNLYKWMSYEEAEKDQNEVKVVVNNQSNAMYFSRNPIPAIWLGDKKFQCRVEICVMPMWATALEEFVKLGNGYYEEIESVDMMRFVENGLQVRLIECTDPVKSVDCQEDLDEAEEMLKALYQ